MRVIAYLRVSTREQAENGYSIGEQEERLRHYCAAKEWALLDVISDPGFSGAKLERPGLQRLIRLAQQRACDAVLVWKLDRLSRSQKDTLYLIEDVLLKNNVAFISMNENFDTSTPFGRAMIGILSVFAQLEREQIRERMAVGREGRAKAGLFHGGGFAPIGYDYSRKEDGGAGLIVNEYEAMQVREAFSLYLGGMSITQLQEYLSERYTTKYGAWRSIGTVRTVLRSKLYTGVITYARKTYPGKHEPLVSQETFDAVQCRLEAMSWQMAQRRGGKPFQSVHVLGGIVWCARCGARYCVNTGNGGNRNHRRQYSYYVCYSRNGSAKHMVRDPNCKNDRWPVDKLEGIVFDKIRQLALDPSAFEQAAHPDCCVGVQEKQNLLRARLAELDAQIERLLDLCQAGSAAASVAAGRIAALQAEGDALNAELEALHDQPPVAALDRARELLLTAASVLDNGTQEEKRELVHSLIDRVELDGENIDIHWNFAPEA